MSGLSKRERVVLETLVPSEAHPVLPKGIFDTAFESFYANFELSDSSGKLKLSFRVTMFLAIWVSPLLIGRLPPISLYKTPTRERALDRLFGSRFFLFRQLALTMKLVVALCYGGDRSVRDAIGYPMQFDDPRREEPLT